MADRLASFLRSLLQWLTLWPLVHFFCRPLHTRNLGQIPGTIERIHATDSNVPAPGSIFVANHCSHADTAVILRSLPARLRRKTHPAAAEDYFFGRRVLPRIVPLLTGAFPFPRKGPIGLRRAEDLLRSGRSVLLYPEGTRSSDGDLGDFKRGVGHLASLGFPVVPIGVVGTNEVLPKGARRPRRASVSVVMGRARRYPGRDEDEIVRDLRRRVAALLEIARCVRPRPRRGLYDMLSTAARSRAALAFLFLWGLAEAAYFPIVPDFPLALLALAAPGRTPLLALAAVAGSVSGGAIAYALGDVYGAGVLDRVPLVTDGMVDPVSVWLSAEGAAAMIHQPLSGIPYKVFGYQAAASGVGLGSFLAWSALARGARLLVVAAVCGVAGRLGRPLWRATTGLLLPLYTTGFALGLARVASAWR